MADKKDVFGELWDRAQALHAEYIFDTELRDRTTFHQRAAVRQGFIESHSSRLRLLFSERRKIQKAIYKILKGELKKRPALLDLLSGEPSAVLPLLEEGVVSNLTLLDYPHNDVVTFVREKLIRSLARKSHVQQLRVAIVPDATDLPLTREVSFLETGWTLPPSSRLSAVDTPTFGEECHREVAPYYRSNQSGASVVTFEHVLQALARGNVERRLHVVDTPVVQRPISSEEHRVYLEGMVRNVSGWSIDQWKPLSEGSPSSYGVLNFNPKH
jgi:hypothetical protein